MRFYLEGPGGIAGLKQASDIRTAKAFTFEGNLTVLGTLSATSEAATSGLFTVVSVNALTVGANGLTNPALNVDTSVASVATGLNVKGAAAAGGLALTTLSSGTNENLTIDAKGSGSVTINGVGTGIVNVGTGNAVGGNVAAFGSGTNKLTLNIQGAQTYFTHIGAAATFGISNQAGSVLTWGIAHDTGISTQRGSATLLSNTAVPAGGTANTGLMFSSVASLGVFFGSGAPILSAAQGSLYVRTDGSSVSTRLYVNTNGTTGWTNVTTAT